MAEHIKEGAVNADAEKSVKSMKKDSDYFKKKYGDKWKSIIYAIANKQQQDK